MIEKTENTNCLAGMKCPKCGSLGPFKITVVTTVLMSDDGSDEGGDQEWGNNSPCTCAACSFDGCVKDFSTEKVRDRANEDVKLNDDQDYILADDCTGIWLTVKKMSVHILKTDEGVVVDVYPLGCEFDGNGTLGSTYVFDSEAEAAIEEAEKKNAEGLNDGESVFAMPCVTVENSESVITEEEAERCRAEHRAELLGLKQYDVTIKAVVTKTYRVDAKDEDEAVEEAHGVFSVLNDEVPEDYDEQTLNVEEVKP